MAANRHPVPDGREPVEVVGSRVERGAWRLPAACARWCCAGPARPIAMLSPVELGLERLVAPQQHAHHQPAAYGAHACAISRAVWRARAAASPAGLATLRDRPTRPLSRRLPHTQQHHQRDQSGDTRQNAGERRQDGIRNHQLRGRCNAIPQTATAGRTPRRPLRPYITRIK